MVNYIYLVRVCTKTVSAWPPSALTRYLSLKTCWNKLCHDFISNIFPADCHGSDWTVPRPEVCSTGMIQIRIIDPKSLESCCIKRTDESRYSIPLDKDSLVPLNWCTMIWMIFDTWSWLDWPQRNAPFDKWGIVHICSIIKYLEHFFFFQLNFDYQKMKQRRWQEIWKASLLSTASLVMRNITLQVV